jgi:hypothetical protein
LKKDPTRLQRDVALKILPPSAAGNPERQRRFAQEAVAAGALNQPSRSPTPSICSRRRCTASPGATATR